MAPNNSSIPKDKNPFKCSQCSSSFGSKYGVIQHVVANHMSIIHDSFNCAFCKIEFEEEEALENHMRIHECPVCMKTFSKDFIIRIHLEQDHDIFDENNLETITPEEYAVMKPGRISNTIEKICKNREKIEEIVEDEHEENKRHIKKLEEMKKNAEKHEQKEKIEVVSEIKKVQSCPFCNDNFSETNELTYHIAIVHDEKLRMKTTIPLMKKKEKYVEMDCNEEISNAENSMGK